MKYLPLLFWVLLTACQEKPSLSKEFTNIQWDTTETLAGIDNNHDGIRDDIEAYIASLPITDDQKMAMRFEAYAIQRSILIDTNNEDEMREVLNQIPAAINCSGINFGDNLEQADKISDDIEAYTMNTEMRTKQYIKFNVAAGGSVTRYPEGDTCEKH